MFLLIPYLDPKKERYEQFNRVYHIFKNIILALMVIIYFLMCFNGLGYNLPVGIIVPILIGILFIVMGNYMAKLKRNWFVGIRRHGLCLAKKWNKTHRFGGKMFILAGFLMIAEVVLPISWKLAVLLRLWWYFIWHHGLFLYCLFTREKK